MAEVTYKPCSTRRCDTDFVMHKGQGLARVTFKDVCYWPRNIKGKGLLDVTCKQVFYAPQNAQGQGLGRGHQQGGVLLASSCTKDKAWQESPVRRCATNLKIQRERAW